MGHLHLILQPLIVVCSTMLHVAQTLAFYVYSISQALLPSYKRSQLLAGLSGPVLVFCDPLRVCLCLNDS